MIELIDVSLSTPGFFRRDPILEDANHVFQTGERVGILAAPGTGKSSLARVLAGIDQPDLGTVHHVGRVSWPIGFAGFLHPNLTVKENLNNCARLIGMTPQEITDFCHDRFAINYPEDKMMQDLSPTQRAMLSYACALSVEGPATWIADEVITVGEPHERAACDAILAERLAIGGLVFVSRNARQLTAYCDRFMVLLNHRLVPCEDLAAAQQALEFSRLAATTAPTGVQHVQL